MKAVTLIKTLQPENVGKTYYLRDGKLHKEAVAAVWEGLAKTVIVESAQAMVDLLTRVTSATCYVIVNGIFRGAGTETFRIYTERRFRQLVEADGANYEDVLKAGVLYRVTKGTMAGTLIGARIKVLMEPSAWLLLDADEPDGFPVEWRGLSFQQRLEILEPYAPGIATVERVELRGSSARVVKDGEEPGNVSHGWICTDDADDIARAGVSMLIRATGGGTFFMSPRHSRETGEITGETPRTSIDIAPWHHGRLNFDSMPTNNAEGYVLADAGITIVNPGGGLFSPGGVAPIEKPQRRAYRERTGHDVRISGRGSGFSVEECGQLKWETPIEVQKVTKTLRAWVDEMMRCGDEKRRCEAPFRASSSEAAFIRIPPSGEVFLYDIGTHTKHLLATEWGNVQFSDDDDEDDTAEGAATDETQNGPKPETSADAAFETLGSEEPGAEDQDTEDRATETFDTFDAAIAALKANKGNTRARDAALRFYADMEPIEQELSEDAIVGATGLTRRTIRATGSKLKQASNPAEAWTHSEIANDFLRIMKKKALMPVGNSGALYIYAADNGTWRRKDLSEVRAVIGRRYRQSDNCKKHSDYSGVTNTLMSEVMDDGFFTSAAPGIATKTSFWRANLEARTVDRLDHAHTNRARFAVQFEPVMGAEPAEFLATLRQAFVATPDLGILATTHGYPGDPQHWAKKSPGHYGDALQAYMALENAAADEQIELLRQMFGATLLGFQHKMQLAVMLYGAANSFKSGCLRILTGMFEPQAVASVAPTELDHDYKRASLAHKRLNSVPELDADTPIPAAAFKSILGEDLVGARMPYGLPFSFVNEASFWTASNHFPTTRDHSDAFFRRWVMVHFKTGRKRDEVDTGLEPRILAKELPAIAGWALEGARTLLVNGMRPSLSSEHGRVMDRWRLENNSVASWLVDSPIDSGVAPLTFGKAPIRAGEAHRRYSDWCRAAGRRAYGRNTFNAEMARLGHVIKHANNSNSVFPKLTTGWAI